MLPIHQPHVFIVFLCTINISITTTILPIIPHHATIRIQQKVARSTINMHGHLRYLNKRFVLICRLNFSYKLNLFLFEIIKDL